MIGGGGVCLDVVLQVGCANAQDRRQVNLHTVRCWAGNGHVQLRLVFLSLSFLLFFFD